MSEAQSQRRSDGRGRRSVRRLRCMDRFIPFQVNSSPPAFPGDSPGNVAAPVRRFHFHHGVARSTKKGRAFRAWYQALTFPPDRIPRGRDTFRRFIRHVLHVPSASVGFRT